MTKKRILVTVGPNSLTEEVLSRCAEADIYVYRINLSHTPIDLVEENIRKIQSWSDVPVCLDSEGAQVRNQGMAAGGADFSQGGTVKIHFDPVLGDAGNISFAPRGTAEQFMPGDRVRIDFNGATFKITEKHAGYCNAEVVHGGHVGSNKAADVDRDVDLAAITEKDKAAIQIGRRLGVRHFALSFAGSADEVNEMRDLCGGDATIISKIESVRALRNLNEILDASDQVLIDRGDLSRQVPIEMIPFFQRRIIATAKDREVPVFVATNLLESMVKAHNPTRAEVNDVVSTLLMGADGLVLAAETAIGAYPIDATHMVRRLSNLVDRWTPESDIEELLAY
jgi:pyruvate kinase